MHYSEGRGDGIAEPIGERRHLYAYDFTVTEAAACGVVGDRCDIARMPSEKDRGLKPPALGHAHPAELVWRGPGVHVPVHDVGRAIPAHVERRPAGAAVVAGSERRRIGWLPRPWKS